LPGNRDGPIPTLPRRLFSDLGRAFIVRQAQGQTCLAVHQAFRNLENDGKILGRDILVEFLGANGGGLLALNFPQDVMNFLRGSTEFCGTHPREAGLMVNFIYTQIHFMINAEVEYTINPDSMMNIGGMIATVFFFVRRQSQAFQNAYAEQYINDCILAYDGRGGPEVMSGFAGIREGNGEIFANISCPNGIVERVLTTLSNVIATGIPGGLPVVQRAEPRHPQLERWFQYLYGAEELAEMPQEPRRRRFREYAREQIRRLGADNNPDQWEADIRTYTRDVVNIAVGGERRSNRRKTLKRK
jgi:hypothetical protein